jgi:thioredoxin-dependent peroxiredoxin
MDLVQGAEAPDFTLTSDAGDEVSLAALRGKPVVLYFYPKDDTHASKTSSKLNPGAPVSVGGPSGIS